MSKVRLDFLNWRPDEDDFENPLIEAKNVLHQSEGWVPYKRPTAGAISAHSQFATVPSMVVKPVGTDSQYAVAWLHNGTVAGDAYTIDLSIGLLQESSGNYSLTGLYTTTTSATVGTKSTLNNISSFDVCESQNADGDPILLFVAIAECTSNASLISGGDASGTTLVSFALSGWTTVQAV